MVKKWLFFALSHTTNKPYQRVSGSPPNGTATPPHRSHTPHHVEVLERVERVEPEHHPIHIATPPNNPRRRFLEEALARVQKLKRTHSPGSEMGHPRHTTPHRRSQSPPPQLQPRGRTVAAASGEPTPNPTDYNTPAFNHSEHRAREVVNEEELLRAHSLHHSEHHQHRVARSQHRLSPPPPPLGGPSNDRRVAMPSVGVYSGVRQGGGGRGGGGGVAPRTTRCSVSPLPPRSASPHLEAKLIGRYCR